MSFKVELTFEDEEAFVLLWCQFIRARTAWKEGIDEENYAQIVYASSWTDALLDELQRHLPDNLERPNGNETGKP